MTASPCFVHIKTRRAGKRIMSKHCNEKTISQRCTLWILRHHGRHKSLMVDWSSLCSNRDLHQVIPRPLDSYQEVEQWLCCGLIAPPKSFFFFFFCHMRDLIQCGLCYSNIFQPGGRTCCCYGDLLVDIVASNGTFVAHRHRVGSVHSLGRTQLDNRAAARKQLVLCEEKKTG